MARSSAPLLAALVLLACAARPAPPPGAVSLDLIMQGPEAVVSPDGLHKVEAEGLKGSLYVKAPRPHLYRYHAVVLSPVVLEYRKGTEPRSDRDEERLRVHLQRSLARELQEAQGWQLAEAPEEGVLRADIGALDMDLLAPPSRVGGARTRFVEASGGVTTVLVLRDSLTGEPLLRFGERRRLPGGTRYPDEVSRVREALSEFAADTRAMLDVIQASAEQLRPPAEG